MKDKGVTPFLRIFKYVWPQWPRIVVIVFTAVLIGILFSLSFATIVPLLKVMMGEEGLHSWVDRKVCSWRYGLDFYVPDSTDFTDVNGTNIAYYLLVTNVKENSWADKAGFKREDRIVGVGSLITADANRVTSSKLLEVLSTAEGESITVKFERINPHGVSVDEEVQLYLEPRTSYINYAQAAVSFLPRGQARVNKARVVSLIILAMVVVTVIRCLATFYQKYMAGKVVQVAIAGLREDVFAHVMEMPMGFFSSKGTSDTVSRALHDTTSAGKGVQILLGKALREPLKAVGTLACAMLINYKLVLIFLCCAPVTVGLGILLGRRIKKFTKRVLRSNAAMLGRLQGAVSALGVVKVYNRQKHEHMAYRRINRKLLKQMLRTSKINAGTGPIMEILGMIGGSAALLVGIYWVTHANMEPSSFFGLLILLGTTAESVRKSSDIWNHVQSANAAAERVFALVDEPVEFDKPGAIELSPLKEQIEFLDVVFTYPGGEAPVLKGINLTVKAGQTVAVVGPNGSGKTTLVNLLPRFYNPDSGSILIDEQDIRNGTLKSLRNQIGMVTQNVVTFNDTIAANIGYGKAEATREEIIEAAKRSFVHEFIEPLPEGYDTVIGEHGSGFSGGQLQRIVIARAIVKNPPILIFDEAMSQIDADSEAKIHKALSELTHDRTCFIIAHRFSTVISADTIVVLDDGQIVAQGSHEELIQSCALYQSLYETQLLVAR